MEATPTISYKRAGIGINPLISNTILFGGLGFGMAAIHPIMLFFWGLIVLVVLWQTVVGIFCHLRARIAILTRKISPTTVVRGMTCRGIAMFDERTQKVYINGNIYNYSDVASMSWEANQERTCIQFNLSKGSNPVQKVHFLLRKSAPVKYQIARNALRWD